MILKEEDLNSMLKHNILEGNFKIANDISKEMSLNDLENELLEIAFETDNISIYFFILDVLNEAANAELHAMASTILSTAYSHVAGSYNLALNHMRKAMYLDPHDITYKEGMLFFHNIPEQLITKAQAIELAKEIIKINPENERAKEILQ